MSTGSSAATREWSLDARCNGDGGIPPYPLIAPLAPNAVMTAGRALSSVSAEQVRPLFELLLRYVGLPQAIRTENDAPFSST